MKILHINSNYLSTALHQVMANTLSELGIDNQVFVATYDKKRSVIDISKNVVVAECFNKRDRIFFDYKQKKIFQAVKQNVSMEKIQVVHAYTLFTDGNIARKIKQEYGIPYVVAVRNTDVNVFFKYMRHLHKRGVKILEDASAIFFLSKVYKNLVFKKYVSDNIRNKLEQKTFIIPNGIDDYWIDNCNKESHKIEEKIKIIYAGVIDKNKNIYTTQKALKILRKEGYKVHFDVVGRVKDKHELRKVVKDRETTYMEPMLKESLIEVYRQNDIFVMPSYTETFGLVYAEAMSQGLPVVYTKGQGFDGQFAEGEIGYSVNPNIPEEIASAIKKILGQYQEIRFRCLDSVECYRWKKICKQYIKIYQQVSIR